jgi:hypothetical protein
LFWNERAPCLGTGAPYALERVRTVRPD